MAWTKTSEGYNGKYAVYSEDLNPKGDTILSKFTSVIDFIPPGCDFTVIANSGATNLSASGHCELYVGYSKTAAVTARYRLNKTPFISLTAEIDLASKILFYDVSANGQYPYYWLKTGMGGTDAIMGSTAGAAVTMKVIPGGRATMVTTS